jgi:hypothetical protein
MNAGGVLLLPRLLVRSQSADAATLVGWNASYVKIDGCGLSSDPVEGQRQRAVRSCVLLHSDLGKV